MGRSKLQGKPWHYEYNKGNGINNSKNCAFNTGNRCACKISANHNLQCVGKLYCEEFEINSGRRATVKSKTRKQQNPLPNNYFTKNQPRTSNKKKEPCVEIGSFVTVESQDTKEIIKLGKITSKDNPFYSKELNSVVFVKGISYKIIQIT